MKNNILVSVAIPSYNASPFLKETVESLIKYKDDIEIIIINDGSKDNTLQIAKELQSAYSDLITIIDKENGGHGSGINTSSKIAKGLYYLVLDADDGLDEKGFTHLLDVIKNRKNNNEEMPDLFVAEHISRYVNGKPDVISQMGKYFKKETLLNVSEIKKIHLSDYFFIHMLACKTSLINHDNFKLEEKCFYEDNEFVYYLLSTSNTYYYLDSPIYLYRVGDSNQSTSLENMKKHYKDAFKVLNGCFNIIPSSIYKKMSKKKKRFVFHELFIIFTLTYAYAYLHKDKEIHKEFINLYKGLKQSDKYLYLLLRKNCVIFSMLYILPECIRHYIVYKCYFSFVKKRGWCC